LHRKFSHLRLHGEWFQPAAELALFVGVELHDVKVISVARMPGKPRMPRGRWWPLARRILPCIPSDRCVSASDVRAACCIPSTSSKSVVGCLRALSGCGWISEGPRRRQPGDHCCTYYKTYDIDQTTVYRA
jgi:hypothetical protein